MKKNNNSNLKKKITCYTDGGCVKLNNKINIGAWAFIINCKYVKIKNKKINHDNMIIGSGFNFNITNNQMEIMAAINAFKRLNNLKSCFDIDIQLFSDSKYLLKGISIWSKYWIKKNWISSNGNPVKNKELWIELIKEVNECLKRKNKIQWIWVKAHISNIEIYNYNMINHYYNSQCDKMVSKELSNGIKYYKKKGVKKNNDTII